MSETTYFLLLNKQETGPFTLAQIQAMIAKEEIPPHTFYAAPGMGEWQHVSELLASVAPPPVALASAAPAAPASTIVIAPAPKPALSITPPAPPPELAAPVSLAPAPPPEPATVTRKPVAAPAPLAPPPMAPPPVTEKSGGSKKKLLWIGGAAALLVVALLAAGWFLRPHTPASSEPPPANVSYKKREKFSQQHVTIPLSKWDGIAGRNLHRAAFQAATNLVAQNLDPKKFPDPDSARFLPFKTAKIVGVQWRFRVQGQLESVKGSGTDKRYDYEIYLARSSSEEWTPEDVSIRKSSDAPVPTGKESE